MHSVHTPDLLDLPVRGVEPVSGRRAAAEVRAGADASRVSPITGLWVIIFDIYYAWKGW